MKFDLGDIEFYNTTKKHLLPQEFNKKKLKKTNKTL